MQIKIGTRVRNVNGKKIWRMAYVLFAKWLPRSCYSIFSMKVRSFFTKHMVQYCGNNVNIEQNVTFGEELSIGDNSTIGFNSDIYGPVEIGKDVMIAAEFVAFTNGHRFDQTDIPMNLQGDTDHKKIIIEDDVWIGRRVMLMPGVTIQKGSVVGAGSVVTKTFPPYSVIAGNPARVVKERKS